MSLPVAIESLRELNEPVPRPFRLPTETEVAAAERTLGVTFPADYRYFLLHGSDVAYGTLEPAVVIPDCGHLGLVEMVQTAWEVGVPRDHLPFCEDNGDYYCLTPDSRVVLWSHDGLFSGRWPDLAHWIQEVWIG
jgi:hypothetical protein